MKRKIIQINEEKCNGCGACAAACHEGAIEMHNGKARLMRDDYCDGLGDCLPACPTEAISIIEREAAAYDEQAVLARKHLNAGGCPGSRPKTISRPEMPGAGGCPGSRSKTISRPETPGRHATFNPVENGSTGNWQMQSRLSQWPVQIKLVPVKAPWFQDAKLLIAADCTAYAYAPFHENFIKGRITLIGCPKLDAVDYSEKLTEIFRQNDIRSITVVRMEVPCCGGLTQAVKTALQNSGKFIPCQIVTISTDGQILD